MRKIHTIFYNEYTNLYCHQQCTKFPLITYCLFHICYLIIIFLTRVRKYLIILLICIFLVISDIEHLFISVGPLSVFFWEISIFVCFLPLSNFFFFFCLWYQGFLWYWMLSKQFITKLYLQLFVNFRLFILLYFLMRFLNYLNILDMY